MHALGNLAEQTFEFGTLQSRLQKSKEWSKQKLVHKHLIQTSTSIFDRNMKIGRNGLRPPAIAQLQYRIALKIEILVRQQ